MKYSHFMINEDLSGVTVSTAVFLKLDTNSWQRAPINETKILFFLNNASKLTHLFTF